MVTRDSQYGAIFSTKTSPRSRGNRCRVMSLSIWMPQRSTMETRPSWQDRRRRASILRVAVTTCEALPDRGKSSRETGCPGRLRGQASGDLPLTQQEPRQHRALVRKSAGPLHELPDLARSCSYARLLRVARQRHHRSPPPISLSTSNLKERPYNPRSRRRKRVSA